MGELSLPLPAVAALRSATLCSDGQLARRAARGDQRAFAEVFARHHQAVFRYCRTILRNDEDAADALQNTMAAVLHGLQGETREIALKPWLFRIAHNESISLIRRRKDDTAFDEDSCAPASRGPEGELLQSEHLRQLVDDMQALPDRQRGALVMRELSDLRYVEIAAAFGVAEGAARQAVYEAREMLHEMSEGRAMACAEVRELISARDGRLLRARKVRAHLRACASCEEFRAAIGQRSAAFASVAPPLPAIAGAAILQGLLGGGGFGAGGGGLAAGGAPMAASVGGGSAVTVNSLAGVALVAKGSGAATSIATKAAAVLATSATLAAGGVIAEQQLQRDSRDAAPSAAMRAPDAPRSPASLSPALSPTAREDRAQRADVQRAADAARSMVRRGDRETLASQRPAATSDRNSPAGPPSAAAPAGRPPAGAPAGTPAPAVASGRSPTAGSAPDQIAGASSQTTPAPASAQRPASTAPAPSQTAPANSAPPPAAQPPTDRSTSVAAAASAPPASSSR